MLIALLDESSINKSFSNSMEGIDKLWHNPGLFSSVAFMRSLGSIEGRRTHNCNDHVKMSKHAVQQVMLLTYHSYLALPNNCCTRLTDQLLTTS